MITYHNEAVRGMSAQVMASIRSQVAYGFHTVLRKSGLANVTPSIT
ncbi:hypothetical protein KP79_PYT19320 [Mizuhopecten yessoensis]|uniref:Uncharacterized protein n=1 Tax=Mizuhopecten yessoensis TaxID=6573 RepID=A0A210Q9I2_MIZYE|nr:hypothetical protein KP79_PYT19320 [Mizuhopecten yessoensis]